MPTLTKRGLNVVLADLAKEGYAAEWFDLQARDFGALHKRERIFIVAYPNKERCGRGIYASKSKQKDATEDERRVIPQTFITHDWEERIQRFKQETLQGKQGFSWQNRPNIPEPLICGSGHGIPNWVDRLKCCGNAVVPQMSQFIARRVKELIRDTEMR